MLFVVLFTHSASLIEYPYIGQCPGTGEANANRAGRGLKSKGPWYGREANVRAGIWRLLIKMKLQVHAASGGHERKRGISTMGEQARKWSVSTVGG